MLENVKQKQGMVGLRGQGFPCKASRLFSSVSELVELSCWVVIGVCQVSLMRVT